MRFAIITIAVLIPLALLGSLGWSLAAGVAERPLGPQALSPAPIGVGSAERGEALYRAKCFGCHVPEARVGPSHATTDFKVRYAEDETIVAVVRGGRGVMPAFSEEMLSDGELADIIAYIRILK